MATTQLVAPPTRPDYYKPKRLHKTMTLCVLMVITWSLALDNGIFVDESLYILGGQTILDHWFSGAPIDRGLLVEFSGAPEFYPVLAAALDNVGGLALVRGFSLLCIVLTMFILRSLTRHVFDEHAGLLAAATFGFTGPVIYAGFIGTSDAVVILLLAVAWWLMVTKMPKSVPTAVLAGLILALAVMTQYAAFVFILPVALTPILTSQHGVPWVAKLERPGIALGVCSATLLIAFRFTGTALADAIKSTTLARVALRPTPRDELAWMIPTYAGLVILLGLLALYMAARRARSLRWTLLSAVLLLTAFALPLGQLRLGEGVSFEKHLAYSALFLAPVAGWALERLWRYSYTIMLVPLVVFMLCALMVGAFKAQDLYTWPDVRPAANHLKNNTEKGIYVSPLASSLKYYLQGDGIKWEATFNTLYPRGKQAIRSAVRDGKYRAFVLQDTLSSSSSNDAVLIEALDQSEYQRKRISGAADEPDFVVYMRK